MSARPRRNRQRMAVSVRSRMKPVRWPGAWLHHSRERHKAEGKKEDKHEAHSHSRGWTSKLHGSIKNIVMAVVLKKKSSEGFHYLHPPVVPLLHRLTCVILCSQSTCLIANLSPSCLYSLHISKKLTILWFLGTFKAVNFRSSQKPQIVHEQQEGNLLSSLFGNKLKQSLQHQQGKYSLYSV